MDAPRYTITVTSLTRGWSFTATHGDDPDLEDPTVRTIPTAPLTFPWGFADDLIPNVLDPDRITFGLWSRTAADQPTLDLGDVMTAVVRLDIAGPVIGRVPVFRVTEADTELVPGDDWSVRTRITGASFLAELPGAFPNYGGSNDFYAHRWGLIGKALGLSIGCPTAWTTPGGMASLLSGHLNREWVGSSALDHAAELLATYVPNGVHHTLVPYYGAGYPAGYTYVDQGYTPPVGDPSFDVPVPDPGTTVKLLIVPASRKLTDVFKLPLSFRDAAGELDVISTPGQATPRMPAVSARYCQVPAVVRRSRDHLVNTVILKGVNRKGTDPLESRPSTYTHTDPASVAIYGPITRTVETQLTLRYYDDDPDVAGPVLAHVPAIAASYLATPASTLAYKEFVIHADAMPDVVADAVLPYLTPSYPGDGADGRVVRHLTVHSLHGDVRLPGADPAGFITSGVLTIADGDITYVVNTTPGQPTYPAAPTPITVGEFTAAAYSLLTVPNVEPTLTVADLDLVDA